MFSKIASAIISGYEAIEVSVESDVSGGIPDFNLVGLADTSVNESKLRIRTALKNSGISFPSVKLVVNLVLKTCPEIHGNCPDLNLNLCINYTI